MPAGRLRCVRNDVRGANVLEPLRDRYGFFFWLRWILAFAGSFVVSAMLWTAILTRIFGPIRGEELMLTWTVSVFGTWFILVIPFMRKKEQIWKRLNTDQEKAVDAWLMGMSCFIGLFVLSAFGWTWTLRTRIFPNRAGFDGVWMKTVFSSWLTILIPLLIWMYRSADTLFRTANERQTYRPRFRTHWIEPKKRILPPQLADKIRKEKPTLPGAHVIDGRLKNGEMRRTLFVLGAKEVVGAYDPQELDFDATQLDDVIVLERSKLDTTDESKWVRFDLTQ